MNVSFYIAKRYLIAKKSQNAINIISWISVISVAIGTFALVVVLSAFNGLENLVESLFESFDADIKVEIREGKVFSASQIDFNQLKDLDNVANYTQVLKEICGVRYKDQQSIVTLKGVENSFLEMSNLSNSIIDGTCILKNNGINYALTGYAIASQLGVYMNKSQENLSIYAPKRDKISTLNPMNAVYRRMIASAGVFYISPEYDTKYMVVPIDFVQDLLEYDDQISSVELTVKDDEQIEETTLLIQDHLGNTFKVNNRLQFNEIIYKTNKTEKWVTFLILVFVLIIAAFNILSSISMLIIEKKKDIATLQSMGATNRLIRRIFFTEGILINLVGAFVGMFLGVTLILLQQHFGLLKLEGGIVEYYPVELKGSELIYILITVIVIGFLTSWYPVRNLTRVSSEQNL